MEEYINSIEEFYSFIIILYIFTFIADHVDILSEYLITLPVMRSGGDCGRGGDDVTLIGPLA